MKPKEYLLQYRKAIERVNAIDRQIEEYYLLADAKAAPIKPDVVRGTGRKPDATAEIAVLIADATERLNERRAEALRILDEIAEVIDAVPDASQSRLLFDRYIARMAWEDIANDIGYDSAHTRGRLHGAALESVREILEGANNDRMEIDKNRTTANAGVLFNNGQGLHR